MALTKRLLKHYLIPPGIILWIRSIKNVLQRKGPKSKRITQFPYTWRGNHFIPYTDFDLPLGNDDHTLLCITKAWETKTVVALASSNFIKMSDLKEDTISISLSLTVRSIEESVSDIKIVLDNKQIYKISGRLVYDQWYNLSISVPESRSDSNNLVFEWVGGGIYVSIPRLEQRKVISSNFHPSHSPKKDNVIVVVLDGLSSHALGCLNSQSVDESDTPYIDSYFEDGQLYTNAYSQSEYTMPSSATIMTGLYPIQHGLFTHDQCQRKLPRDIPTVAEHLRSAGYRTFAYSEANRFIPPYGYSRGFDGFFYRWIYDNGHSSDGIIDNCIQFLEAHRREPTFCFMHFMDTHPPYAKPNYFTETLLKDERWSNPGSLYNDFKMHRDRSDSEIQLLATQKAALRATDLMLFKLLSYLRETKLDESTNVILTADHGRDFRKKVPLLTKERTSIPLIVKGPDISSGYTTELVEACVNIYPTIVQMTGMDEPTHLSGSSILSQPCDSDRLCISESLFRREAEIVIRSKKLAYYSRHEFDPLLGKVDFEKKLGEWLFTRDESTGQEITSDNLVDSKRHVVSERQRYAKDHFDGLPRYFTNDSILDETRHYPE